MTDTCTIVTSAILSPSWPTPRCMLRLASHWLNHPTVTPLPSHVVSRVVNVVEGMVRKWSDISPTKRELELRDRVGNLWKLCRFPSESERLFLEFTQEKQRQELDDLTAIIDRSQAKLLASLSRANTRVRDAHARVTELEFQVILEHITSLSLAIISFCELSCGPTFHP